MKDLNKMNLAELRNLAKELQIKGWWQMKKVDLIEAIEVNNPQVPEAEIVAPETIKEKVEVKPLSKVEKMIEATLDESEVVVDEPKMVEEKSHRKNAKRLIEYKGKTQTLTAWAKELGIRHQTLYNRIVIKGMDPAEAFETPIKKGVS